MVDIGSPPRSGRTSAGKSYSGTPLRMKIKYLDGKNLEVKLSYGGAKYASMAFNTKLDGYLFAFRKVKSS